MNLLVFCGQLAFILIVVVVVARAVSAQVLPVAKEGDAAGKEQRATPSRPQAHCR